MIMSFSLSRAGLFLARPARSVSLVVPRGFPASYVRQYQATPSRSLAILSPAFKIMMPVSAVVVVAGRRKKRKRKMKVDLNDAECRLVADAVRDGIREAGNGQQCNMNRLAPCLVGYKHA